MRHIRRARLPHVIVAVVLVGLSLAGILTWALWPEPESKPRAREYLAFTACLLTDDRGLTGEHAAAVWAGMQDASLATRAKVQYLPVAGPATTANALPYLASLMQRHCDLVVAVGAAQVDAVSQSTTRYPEGRFVTVDTPPGSEAVASPTAAPAPTTSGNSIAKPSRAATTASPGADRSPTRAASPAPVTTVTWSSAAQARQAIDTIVRKAVRHTTR